MNVVAFNIQHNGHWILILLFIVSAIFIGWYYYRRTEPAVQKMRRILLGILRTGALLILSVLLLEPVLSITREYFRSPRGAVLVDESASMSITDRRGSRKSLVDSLMRKDDFRRFRDRFKPDVFAFGREVRSVAHSDSFRWNVEGTNIAAVQKFLSERNEGNAYDFLVLVSDGAYNLGKDPREIFRDSSIPVYTIAVGDSGGQTDVSLHHVAVPEVVYAGRKVIVQAAVRACGVEGSQAAVTLSEKGKAVASRLIDLPGDGRETIAAFDFTPAQAGIHQYNVSVSTVPGEVTDKNNSHAFFIKVLKSKTQILIIGGQPSPDYSFLVRTLSRDPGFVVQNVVEHAPGQTFPKVYTLDDNTIDAAVLIDFPNVRSSPNLQTQMHNFLQRNRVPLFVLAGKTLSSKSLAFYRSILSIRIRKIWNSEQEIFLKSTSAGQEHPVLQFEGSSGGGQVLFPTFLTHPVRQFKGSSDGTESLWTNLPPVFCSGMIFADITGGQPLAVLDGIRSGFGIGFENIPLLISAVVKERKFLFINAYGTWRWGFFTQKNGRSFDFYKEFLGNAIRWLMRKDDERFVRIRPDKDVYRSGEEIIFRGQINNNRHQPVDTAQVRVELRDSSGVNEGTLHSKGNGYYEGSFKMIEPGSYTYIGKASSNGKELGSDSGELHVGAFSLEMINPQRNNSVLRGLAQITGGKYYPDAALTSIYSDIPFTKERLTRDTQWDFFNSLTLFGIVIGFLTLEWFLRKKWGML